MNRDETKQAIAVMQHYADGGDVQSRSRNGADIWRDATHPDGPLWHWGVFEYRAKPKPLECWVWVVNDGSFGDAVSDGDMQFVYKTPKGRWVRMREVE